VPLGHVDHVPGAIRIRRLRRFEVDLLSRPASLTTAQPFDTDTSLMLNLSLCRSTQPT
jgi:hypothetical protein